MRRLIGLITLIAAFAALIPGVTRPILILDGWVDKAELTSLGKRALAENPDLPALLVSLSSKLIDDLNIEGQLHVFTKSRSIVGTVQQLYQSGNLLVAFLIAMFSMIIPAVKLLFLLYTALFAQSRSSQLIGRVESVMGKWSMADVFVIAIMVAYLAAVATRDTEELFTLEAQFATGFYYFLGYCLLSILGSQLLSPKATMERTQVNPG